MEREINKRKAGVIGCGVLALTTLLGTLFSSSIVPAGHVGIVDKFGVVSETELESGFHMVDPLAWVIKYNVQTQEHMEHMEVPTNEGLTATVDVSVLYHVMPDRADGIYKGIGDQYKEKIVVPGLRNVARDVIAGHSSEDLYNPDRTEISGEIMETLAPFYANRGIELEDVLLRNVKLPQAVRDEIQVKIQAKHHADGMQYILQEQEMITQQREEEARGIAAVSSALNENYLQWQYIKNLKTLAESSNTTFVITPYSSDLTPKMPIEIPIQGN